MMNNFFDDLANLPKALSAKAKSSVLAPFVATATGFDTASQKYQKKIDEVEAKAETYLAVSLGLQAIASFAALGIMIYSVKNFNKRTRSWSSRRSSKSKRGKR